MQKLIRNAKLSGHYDQGVFEVKGNPVYIETAPVVVFTKSGPVAATTAVSSSSSSSAPAPTAVPTTMSEVVEYYNVKCDRGMSWDAALTTLANDRQTYNDNEAALAKLVVNRKQRPEKSNRYQQPALFGFYITRNISAGKHYVIVVTEKLKSFQGIPQNNVNIYRPSNGKNERHRVEILDKYRPIAENDARQLWIETHNVEHLRLFNEHVSNMYLYIFILILLLLLLLQTLLITCISIAVIFCYAFRFYQARPCRYGS